MFLQLANNACLEVEDAECNFKAPYTAHDVQL